ncbi:unnamed protein product [Chrysoparadoxa australica]
MKAISFLSGRYSTQLADLGASSLIASVLTAWPKDREIQYLAVSVSRDLSKSSSKTALHLAELGVCQAIVRAMQTFPSDADTMRVCCEAIVCLTSKEASIRSMMGDIGACPAVVLAFKAHPGNQALQLEVLHAVNSLALDGGNRTLLGRVGCCQSVVQSMTKFPDQRDLSGAACKAVSHLAALSGFNRTLLSHCGACEAVAAALHQFGSSSDLQYWGCQAVANLVAESDPSDTTTKILRAGLPSLITRALKEYISLAPTQRAGLQALAKVAGTGEEGRAAVFSAGGVQRCEHAMRLFPEDEAVQMWGCAAVREVGQSDDSSLAVMTESGVLAALVKAVYTGNLTGRDVQYQSIAAMVVLGQHMRAKCVLCQCGAGAAVSHMMETYPTSLKVQRLGCAAISTLTAQSRENKLLVGQSKGVMTALVAAMKTFKSDDRLQCNAALAIHNLTWGTESNARLLVAVGAAQVMATRPAKHKGSSDVLNYLMNGICNLAAVNDSMSDYMGTEGCCEAVVAALRDEPMCLQIQGSGCRTVAVLARRDENQHKFLKAGATKQVLRSVTFFRRDRQVQFNGMEAINQLCRDSRLTRLECFNSGIVNTIAGTLEAFSSDVDLVLSGFQLLLSLLQSTPCITGNMDIVLQAMEKNTDRGLAVAAMDTLTSMLAAPPAQGSGGGGWTSASTEAGLMRRINKLHSVVKRSVKIHRNDEEVVQRGTALLWMVSPPSSTTAVLS